MKKSTVLIFSVLLITTFSCKKSPTNSTPIAIAEVEGTYIGWGRPESIGQNVRLTFIESDSGLWQGSIRYDGTTLPVTVTYVSMESDSVMFEFSRFNTYRMLGLVADVAIRLNVLEPQGQPTYTLNRIINGFNLSGEWRGMLFSDLLQDDAESLLYVDQQGVLFDGDIRATFPFSTLSGRIDEGGILGSSFFFGGNTDGSQSGFPFRFDGQFVNPDSMAGSWQVSGNNIFGSGTFLFRRRF